MMRRSFPILFLAGVTELAAVVPPGLSGQIVGVAQQPTDVVHYDQGTLSKPSYDVRMEHNVRVPMRDGVTLSADIYRPDADGTFPVILVRTPYSNNSLGAVEQSKWFAERGYVVVQQDVRGRYDSDGTFYAFKNEPDDGFDTDEWLGTQPWSNGKIGTIGESYVGFTQMTQAIRGSEYLTAMAPTVTTLDIYGNWIYTGGAFSVWICPAMGRSPHRRAGQPGVPRLRLARGVPASTDCHRGRGCGSPQPALPRLGEAPDA